MIGKKDVVYIAGPMSKKPALNYPAFYGAEALLRERFGCTVLNPARHGHGLKYEEYIRRGLADVESANVIVLLPGWNHSPGAIMELARAIQLNLKIVLFEDVEREYLALKRKNL